MYHNPVPVEMASPFMLWQYVSFPSPDKSPDGYPPSVFGAPPNFVGQRAEVLPEQVYPSHLHFGLQRSMSHDYFSLQNIREHQQNVLPKKLNMCGLQESNVGLDNGERKDQNSNNVVINIKKAFTENTKSNISSPRKGSSFTIDAILSKENGKSPTDSKSSKTFQDLQNHLNEEKIKPCPLKMPSNPMSYSLPVQDGLHTTPPYNPHDLNISRRHERLLGLSHPYFYPHQFETPRQSISSSLNHNVLLSTPTSSSSSGQSSCESAPSSTSTSPESDSSSTLNKDKRERRTSGKSKRIRTIFTPEQLERLEAEFERQQYMVGTERYYLAASLNLSEAQVKVWFQNRRIKWRKQHLEQQQARLAQGDLYRDIDEGDDSEDESEADDSMARIGDSTSTFPGDAVSTSKFCSFYPDSQETLNSSFGDEEFEKNELVKNEIFSNDGETIGCSFDSEAEDVAEKTENSRQLSSKS